MSFVTRILLLLTALLVAASVVIFVLRFPVLAGLIAAGRVWKSWRRWRASGGYSYGTARAATVFDMLKAGFLRGVDDGESLIFGSSNYAEPPTRFQAFRALLSPSVRSATACRMMIASVFRRYNTGLVRIKHFVHCLTVAPAGAGKSVSVIIMNLLSYRGSCVINDPSGELWKATAAYRRDVMKHRCFRLDPFGVAGPASESDCLNPFDFVDSESLDFAEQVRDIADAIVLKDDDQQPHFNERSVDMIAGYSAFTCALENDKSKRNLSVVRDILSSRKSYLEAMTLMQENTGFHGLLANYGHQLTWLVDRELGSVQSTVHRQLAWMQSPPIVDCLSRSTFDPRWLWTGKVDIYIITPHDRLTTLAGFLRLQLSTIIRLLARTGDEKHSVLFILDEIGHCGRLRLVEDAITLWRKAGIRIWLFVQSLDQLRKCYGERAQTVIDNCGTQQYFGISSYDTAEVLSKRVGDCTLILESIGRNAGRSRSQATTGPNEAPGTVSSGWSTTLSEAARRLLKPEEILVLPADLALLFHKNMPVMPLQLVKYFTIRKVMKRGTGREKSPGLRAAIAAVAALLLAAFAFFYVTSFQPPPLGGVPSGRTAGGWSRQAPRWRQGAGRYPPQPPMNVWDFDSFYR